MKQAHVQPQLYTPVLSLSLIHISIILSPSSKIDKSFLKGAKKRLKSWGLEVIIAKHAGSAHGTYAGSIQQRLKDLQEAMDDEKAKVILCSRGGYGAVHLVGQLDFTRFRQHPKWLIGFSDKMCIRDRDW